MYKVDVREYPDDLEWDDKVRSMPNIPRGDAGLVGVLMKAMIRLHRDYLEAVYE